MEGSVQYLSADWRVGNHRVHRTTLPSTTAAIAKTNPMSPNCLASEQDVLENHGVSNWFREKKHARIKRMCWSFLKKKTLTLNKKWQLENVLRKVLHQAHMFLTYDYLSDSWNLIYYLETALCKWDETHTTHSMGAWCNHPHHHHLQVVAWKLPLPPFWFFQKLIFICFCTINLFFFWSGRTHNGSLISKDQGPCEGEAPTDAAALWEPCVHPSHMSAKLPSVGLGFRQGFALPINETASFFTQPRRAVGGHRP